MVRAAGALLEGCVPKVPERFTGMQIEGRE